MTLRTPSPILQALARHYETSLVGRTGQGARDVQPLFDDLLVDAAAREGDAYELALHQLDEAQRAGIISVEYDNPLARTRIHKVRLSPANEAAFYRYLGHPSPTQRRAQWAALFQETADWKVPARFETDWRMFCMAQAEAAITWNNLRPFKREEIEQGRELLALAVRLLSWEGEQLIRWVSSVLCRDSKRLERQQNQLELLLNRSTRGRISSFVDLGILPLDPDVTFHGPLRLKIDGAWWNYAGHQGSVSLSRLEIERAEEIVCDSSRCLTVENKTPFRELSRRRSAELLIQTSYPNDATIILLRRLGESARPPEFWHFGDTDPAGFDILNDLRTRSRLPFRSLHMRYRPHSQSREMTASERARVTELMKLMPDERRELEAMLLDNQIGDFEQEFLKKPPLIHWPFYALDEA